MPDVFDKEKRSWIMSRVTGKDTKPEMVVRRAVHGLGYRYRLHGKNLPGHPDLVLTRHKKIVFVHGCFWHGHEGCKRSKRPSSNTQFWNEKIDKTMRRDIKVEEELKALGWNVLVVWECETKNPEELMRKLERFLHGE
ncbi:MAG TPA: very short patch repair endonuclease [Candidatus Aquicultor sp.]|jgi:DNA mismatch endonuclease (patch repair protein)